MNLFKPIFEKCDIYGLHYFNTLKYHPINDNFPPDSNRYFGFSKYSFNYNFGLKIHVLLNYELIHYESFK